MYILLPAFCFLLILKVIPLLFSPSRTLAAQQWLKKGKNNSGALKLLKPPNPMAFGISPLA
jgi:hypothetical protein